MTRDTRPRVRCARCRRRVRLPEKFAMFAALWHCSRCVSEEMRARRDVLGRRPD